MARWQPVIDQQIGSNEHLGRRLFDEPLLAGAQDQRPFTGILLDHFLEKRDDGQVSLDRLGQSSVDKRVLNHLLPLASSAAKRFRPPKRFDGWSVLRARFLSNPPCGTALSVVPSPILEPENEANIYHAHIVPGVTDPYSIALHLRHLFTSHGEIKQVVPGAQGMTGFVRFRNWLKTLVSFRLKSK